MGEASAIRVLLVENEPSFSEFVAYLLERNLDLRFAVDIVRSLADALARLEKEQYDAVLLDLGLPDADGLVAFRTMRAAHPQLPIVVLTGNPSREFRAQALAEGARAYIDKGAVEAAGLVGAIRAAVEAQLGAPVASPGTLKRLRDVLLQMLQLQSEEALAETASGGSPIRVLHIDDSPRDARLVALALERRGGVTVQHVSTLSEGLKVLRTQPRPDVVLLDLLLPGECEGLEALHAVLGLESGVPVLVLTGLGDEQTGERAIIAGADDFLAKDDIATQPLGKIISYAVGKAKRQRSERLRMTRELASLHVEMLQGLARIESQMGAVKRTGEAALGRLGEQTDGSS